MGDVVRFVTRRARKHGTEVVERPVSQPPREPQFQPDIPEWLVQYEELARQIAAEGDEFMPGPKEFSATDDLERAGIVEEAVFFGGGAITYRITERGRRWLAGIKPRR